MSDNNISILEGSTFLVASPNGDIDAGPNEPEGFFYKDTRHLSKWKLTVEGITLDVLSTDASEYYYAQHFCVPPTGTIYKNPTLSIVRRRLIGDGFVEHLTVLNHGSEPEEIELHLEIDSDFADLFEVKDALKKKGEFYHAMRDHHLVLGYKRESFVRETIVSSSVPPTEQTANSLVFRITLQPKSVWRTELDVTPTTSETIQPAKFATTAGSAMRENLKQWFEQTPTVTCHPEAMRVYARSLLDIA